MADGCIFCAIVAGKIPAKRVHEDDHAIAFHDLSPQAPTHILVIPRRHIASLADTTPDDRAMLGNVIGAATEVARAAGLEPSGYRLVVNTGAGAGQSVFHIHCHVLGGRPMRWPPG